MYVYVCMQRQQQNKIQRRRKRKSALVSLIDGECESGALRLNGADRIHKSVLRSFQLNVAAAFVHNLQPLPAPLPRVFHSESPKCAHQRCSPRLRFTSYFASRQRLPECNQQRAQILLLLVYAI